MQLSLLDLLPPWLRAVECAAAEHELAVGLGNSEVQIFAVLFWHLPFE